MTKLEVIAKIAELKAQAIKKQKEIDNYKYVSSVGEYDDFLDECYGECEIAGGTYRASYALKLVDETAYNTGKSDYDDSIDITTVEDYKELLEELEELENEIEELKDNEE